MWGFVPLQKLQKAQEKCRARGWRSRGGGEQGNMSRALIGKYLRTSEVIVKKPLSGIHKSQEKS